MSSRLTRRLTGLTAGILASGGLFSGVVLLGGAPASADTNAAVVATDQSNSQTATQTAAAAAIASQNGNSASAVFGPAIARGDSTNVNAAVAVNVLTQRAFNTSRVHVSQSNR